MVNHPMNDTSTDRRSAEERARAAKRYRTLDLSSVGLSIPIAVVIGFWAGGFLAGLIGPQYERTGELVGLAFGIVAGFYNVWKTVQRLSHPVSDGPPSAEHPAQPRERGAE